MKKFFLFFVSLLACAFASFALADEPPVEAAATAPVKKHKIVFQVNFDGEDRFNDVLTNVENTQSAFGKDNVEIVVIAHSSGAGLLTKGNEARTKRIEAAEADGAKFGLCKFTAASKKIADSDIIPGVTKVNGGIPEVVRLVEQGYTYIKLY